MKKRSYKQISLALAALLLFSATACTAEPMADGGTVGLPQDEALTEHIAAEGEVERLTAEGEARYNEQSGAAQTDDAASAPASTAGIAAEGEQIAAKLPGRVYETEEERARAYYQDSLELVLNKCYMILEDIAYLRAHGFDKPAYAEVEALLLRGINGRPKSERYDVVSLVQGKDVTELNSYGIDEIYTIKQKYPAYFNDDPLYETLKWSLAWKQRHYNAMPAGARQDPEIRALLFPNLGQRVVELTEDGTTTVYYEGYEGKIYVYMGINIPTWQEGFAYETNPKIHIYDGRAIIKSEENITVSVAPISEFGFRLNPVYTGIGPGHPILVANGPHVYYGVNYMSDSQFTAQVTADSADHIIEALKGKDKLYELFIKHVAIGDFDALMAHAPIEYLSSLIMEDSSLQGKVDLSAFPQTMGNLSFVGNAEMTELILPEGMTQMTALGLTETGLTSLDCLRDVTSVKRLFIPKSKIKSLAGLEGKTIEHLSLSIDEEMDISALSEIRGLKVLMVNGEEKYRAAVEAELADMPDVEVNFRVW